MQAGQDEKVKRSGKIVVRHEHDSEHDYIGTRVEVVGQAYVKVSDVSDCANPDHDTCGNVVFVSKGDLVLKLDRDDQVDVGQVMKMYGDAVADATRRCYKFLANRKKLLDELRKLDVPIREET